MTYLKQYLIENLKLRKVILKICIKRYMIKCRAINFQYTFNVFIIIWINHWIYWMGSICGKPAESDEIKQKERSQLMKT